MSEARLLNLFTQSTEMYKNDNYQACIALINDCLLLQPTSPTLYSNRAIANFHLSNLTQAQVDLQRAIQIDYLNHIAYFNLFSLHLTNTNFAASFQNLCFSLSSLCAKVANKQKNLSLAEKAVYYSFNNKQALSMVGLFHLEKGKFDLALKFLRQAEHWQSDSASLKKMQKTISWLLQHTKEEAVLFEQNLISGDKYKLKTKLSFPNRQGFEITIDKMLQEFNQLYSRLLKLNQQQLNLLPQGLPTTFESSSLKEVSENSSEMKEYKNANQQTTYTSKLIQDHQNNREQSEANFQVSSLKIQQSYQPSEIHSQNHQYEAETNKQTQKKEEKHTLINFKVYYAHVLPTQEKKSNNFYAVLKYDSENNGLSITSCESEKSEFIQWNEKSQPFKLARNASSLQIKVFDKNIFQLEDDLVGVGWLQVGQLGTSNVPLLDNNHRHVANVVVGVQLCRE